MIGFLRGEVAFLGLDYCLLDVNGVGYRVFISNYTRGKLHPNEIVKLNTYTSVREDAILLYGFYTEEEYQVFTKLISVSKVGPKAALGILSAMSPDRIVWAIQNKQITLLTNAPGIGKKTAERIILELKDKMADVEIKENPEFNQQSVLMPEPETEVRDDYGDALEALMGLGYTRQEVLKVIKKAGKLKDTEEIIKFALKELSL